MLTRILAACVGLPLLLAVVLFLPPVATAILFALACGVAAYEMLWRTGILKHRRILVYTVVAAMANVMWSWLRACSIVSEQTLWLCALLGLFVYFCALFCELLAAHTELRFTAVCVALFSGFVYPFLIGALVRLRGMDGGKFYILVAFLLSMVADSGAYFVGRAGIGSRRRMVRRKSVPGCRRLLRRRAGTGIFPVIIAERRARTGAACAKPNMK